VSQAPHERALGAEHQPPVEAPAPGRGADVLQVDPDEVVDVDQRLLAV